MRQVTLDSGANVWSLRSSQYAQEAVANVEKHLMSKGLKLPSRADTPLRTAYRPELDVSPVLDPTEAVYYQSLVGVLCWMVELGRVEICLEVSIMSSWLAMPRKGQY